MSIRYKRLSAVIFPRRVIYIIGCWAVLFDTMSHCYVFKFLTKLETPRLSAVRKVCLIHAAPSTLNLGRQMPLALADRHLSRFQQDLKAIILKAALTTVMPLGCKERFIGRRSLLLSAGQVPKTWLWFHRRQRLSRQCPGSKLETPRLFAAQVSLVW